MRTAFALVVSELTEGKGSQPTENPSDKERNALALVVALALVALSDVGCSHWCNAFALVVALPLLEPTE